MQSIRTRKTSTGSTSRSIPTSSTTSWYAHQRTRVSTFETRPFSVLCSTDSFFRKNALIWSCTESLKPSCGHRSSSNWTCSKTWTKTSLGRCATWTWSSSATRCSDLGNCLTQPSQPSSSESTTGRRTWKSRKSTKKRRVGARANIWIIYRQRVPREVDYHRGLVQEMAIVPPAT